MIWPKSGFPGFLPDLRGLAFKEGLALPRIMPRRGSDNLFRLLAQYGIEATLVRTQSAATRLLDHIDGWQKVYADDIATIPVRKAGAVHTAEPAVDPKANEVNASPFK